MTRICIENLMRTDRPLTWLPKPTCDRCSLPFAFTSDAQQDRVPFLLSCRHLLCGPCVSEHAQSDSIQCDRCNKEVAVQNKYGNVLLALHPSFYMLGKVARMEQELVDIELYRLDEPQEAKVAALVDETSEDFCIEPVSANDLKTPKQLRKVLEQAFDAHEISTYAFQRRAQSYPDNVDQVIKEITAHFLTLHNALQLEEERVLQQVRQAYLEQRQHTEQQQLRLAIAKERLKKLHTRASQFKRDAPASDDKSWLKFSEEVKCYLETEPLKLPTKNSFIPLTSFHPNSDKFLNNIGSSYRLTLPNHRTQLVPFTAIRKKQKNDSYVATPVKEEESRSVAPTPTPTPTPTTSRGSITSERRNHHEPSSRRNDRGLSDASMYSTRNRDTKRRDKKSSKSGVKSHGSRVVLDAVAKEKLKRCFSTVTITCIENPLEIYVQDELHGEATKALIELCQTEADEYEAVMITAKKQLHVEAGEFYLVQPENSDRWYRARVLEILNGTETASEQFASYRVQYVDFGGKDTVLQEQIRPITDDLANIEGKAIKCSLYGIVSPGSDSDNSELCWPAECHQLMKDFVGNRKMLMYEVDSSPSGFIAVDFFLPPLLNSSSTASTDVAATDDTIDVTLWEGYYPPMSLRKTLIYMQQCLEVRLDSLTREAFNRVQLLNAWITNVAEAALKRCTIPRAPELKEYDLIDVHITHSQSPDCLYIMPMEWKKTRFVKLQEEMDALCQQQTSAHKVFPPYVGLVCGFSLATQDHSRVWLRGRVVKFVPGICEMFALDTGESMIVRCEDMFLFPPASGPLCEYPLAVCCRLEHIHPKGVGGTVGFSYWSPEAIEEFNMLMKSKTLPFAMKVGSLWKETGVYSVLLYLRNKSDVDTCINKMLVKQGHAECMLGKEAEIVDLAHTATEPVPTSTADGNVSVSSNKVIDPRVPVDVLRVVSPSEIYVRLSSRKADLDGLHQTIQQHMDEAFDGEAPDETGDSSAGWQIGDICLVFTSPPDGSTSEWFRARITNVQEEGKLYDAFLIDRALTVQVHRTNVARMVPRIAQLQPGAVRCQLACVEPVKSSDHWGRVAVDALIGIIHSYEKHAISLDVKRSKAADEKPGDVNQSLSVVLWGVRVSVRQALAPQKTEYRNINQLLAVRGMAHLCGTFRVFATKGDSAREELQSIEKAVEKMTLCEYEKLQQFFRTIAADSAEAEGFGAREDGNQTAKVVLTSKGVDTETVRVEIDDACASVLSLAEDNVATIADWPESDPIEKTVFVGMPTHIGNDGTVFLYDMCQEPVLHHIRDKINEHMRHAEVPQKPAVFQPGEPCLAKYHLDEMYYRGSILSVLKGNKYRVLFVDYGNEETCRGINLRKHIICGRVPVQTNRFRLSGIAPKEMNTNEGKSSWPENALLACHGVCVQQPCTVRVDTQIWSPDIQQDTPFRFPIPCKLFRLKDSIDVHSALLELGMFKYCVEKSVEYDSCYTVVRSTSRRYEPIAYPTTIVDTGPSLLQPLITPEERDLMQFMQDIEMSIKIEQHTNDFEDPNEIPDDTGVDSGCLNRAQLIYLKDDDDDDDDDDDQQQQQRQQQLQQSFCSLPSPASFISSELETSTRFSEEQDEELASVSSRSAGAVMYRGLFVSPVDWNQSKGFFGEFTNFSNDLMLHVFPHLEGHTHRIARMSEKVQEISSSQEDLFRWQASLVEIGAACLAPYSADGLYYRAIIEAIYDDADEVSVLYVDYLNRANVPISELRKCPVAVRAVPLRNAEVRLWGVRPNPRLRLDDIGRRLIEVLVRPFYVRVVSTSRTEPDQMIKPEVEFYTDYDCNTLAYQKMIEEKYFYSTKT